MSHGKCSLSDQDGPRQLGRSTTKGTGHRQTGAWKTRPCFPTGDESPGRSRCLLGAQLPQGHQKPWLFLASSQCTPSTTARVSPSNASSTPAPLGTGSPVMGSEARPWASVGIPGHGEGEHLLPFSPQDLPT